MLMVICLSSTKKTNKHMNHDGKLDIAYGVSAESKVWKNKKVLWSELVEKLSIEHKTKETYKEYMALSKTDQGRIKDIGGYVGGYLRGGRRNIDTILHRQILTLDIDFAHSDFWDEFTLLYHHAAVLHSTHKHHPSNPRFRLIMPLSREVTPEEYEAIARKIAGNIDIELFDSTTFEVNRLMFWPSNPIDVDYYFRSQKGEFLNADEVLNEYVDWTDTTAWPISARQKEKIKLGVDKQEDPTLKGGIVGIWCRTYGIEETIEKFLSDKYDRLKDGRYTYKHGTTAGGLVIYDDKFSFSHHGTDPSGGRLCNSFDLVRIHMYGHLDEGTKSGSKLKSFEKMEELARNDKNVRKLIATEKIEEVKYDFVQDDSDEDNIEEDDIEWMAELEVDRAGRYLSTSTNLNIIFANDKRLKGLFRHNRFDEKDYIFGNMPWRRITEPEPIKNVDYSGVRNYVETVYGITGSLKIEDSLQLEFEKRSFHPVVDYLNSLKWDGKQRVDLLLVEYFGVDDTIYTREAIRKMLVGAVGRVMVPGIKFDYVLTLVGKQGTGKSTFVKKLGMQWFSDTFMTVHGKEALEQIQGAWLIEMAELSGLRKAEVESVKHFISKQEDTFRPAYGRTTETYKRQCVFFGTTNNKDFLRDPSGNRRFIPIDIDYGLATKSVFDDLDQPEIDQIWAEAVYMFKKGEPLYMSSDAERLAKIEQLNHSETDERAGMIEDYLNMLLPAKWDEMDIDDRRIYIQDPLSYTGTMQREYVCMAEVWCECLGKDKSDMTRYNTREINDILRGLEGWEQQNSTRNFEIYGKQKFYKRR